MDASLVQGYFTFAFREHGGRRVVRHTEGVRSQLPWLPRIIGVIYFGCLHPTGGVDEELRRLKQLLETRVVAGDS